MYFDGCGVAVISPADKGCCSNTGGPLGVTTVAYDVISFPSVLFFSV